MTMNLQDYLVVTDADRRHFQDVYARYRLLHDQPDRCRPAIIINTPVEGSSTWEQRLTDPLVMLRNELDGIRPHLAIGDDRVPSVRVQFGTAQVAAAFGCPMHIPDDSPPAAGGHVLASAAEVHDLAIPSLDAGWFGKLAEWTALWKENLPEGVQIQHPDIQSAFNSAHLIRGNDILTDFYDHPAEVGLLLDKVTDFMLAVTRHVRAAITDDPDWFLDWGSLWKGSARISNCSMQMISPAIYREFVLPRDTRFLDTIGGGRMHYCGLTGDVIADFLAIGSLTGIDVDTGRHDFRLLCEQAPARLVLAPWGFGEHSGELARLLRGDWPAKRNIVITAGAPSVDEGKRLLDRLRESMPY